MVNQNKKDKAIVRYLVAGTAKILHEDELELSVDLELDKRLNKFSNSGYEFLESDLPKTSEELQVGHFYTVYLRERVIVVFPQQPKVEGESIDGYDGLTWPAGLAEDDLHFSYKRVISYQYEDGKPVLDDVVETIVFGRSAMVNLVTGQVTYMAWQAQDRQSFNEVATPKLSGYVADLLAIPAVDAVEFADDENKETRIQVTYRQQAKAAQVKVIAEGSGEVLQAEIVEGFSNTPISYPIASTIDRYLAKGYEVVSNPFNPAPLFSSVVDEEQVLTIVVKPKVLDVALGEFPQVGEPIYAELPEGPVWPASLGEEELSKPIRRTIITQHEDGTEMERLVQEVLYHRTAQFNLLTQEVSYGKWELVSDKEGFDAFIPETLDGYSARPRRIPEIKTVTITDRSSIETIVYSRKIQRVLLQFVEQDRENRILYQEQLVGKTGQPLSDHYKTKIQEFINNGYDIVGDTIPEDALFAPNSEGNAIYTITLSPRQLVVLPEHPKVAGTYIDEEKQTGPKWPVGVSEADLTRLITRKVYHLYENGKEALPAHVDGVFFQRQAEVNLVTGEVTYGDWDQELGTIPAYDIPELAGYHPDRQSIPAIENVGIDSTDFAVTAYYVKAINQQAYTFYNVTTQTELESATISGRSSQKLQEDLERRLTPYLDKGYELVNPNYLALSLKNMTADTIRVDLREVNLSVSSDNPQPAFGLVEGYSSVVWPVGLAQADLQKTVSRTIRFLSAEGDELADDLIQKVQFSRSAQVNLVTGQVDYEQWQSESAGFSAVEIPSFAGYVCRQEELPAADVDVNRLNQVVELHYDAQPCLVTILFIDEHTGEEVSRYSIPGKENQVLPFSNDLESNLEHLGLEAYTVVGSDLPSELTFKQEETIYTVRLLAKTITITPDQPKLAYSKEEVPGFGVVDWPVGLEKSDLNADFVRSIRYCDQFGQELITQTVEQVATFTRQAEYNLGTGEIHYSDWQSEVLELPSVSNPEIEGYQAVEGDVAALTLAEKHVGQHLLTEVTYYKQPYQVNLILVNQLDEKVLSEVPIKVADKAEAVQQIESILLWYQSQGYSLVSEDLDVTSWTRTESQEIKYVLEPQLIKISLEHIQEGFSSFDEEVAHQLLITKGLSSYNLSRHVSRTIHYLYTTGKTVVTPYQDDVLFKRNAWVNLVTGDVFYDAWASYYPVFDEVLSPVVEGYTASKEIVEAVEGLEADDNNIIETVIYTPNIQQVVVNLIDKSTGNVIYAESITSTDKTPTSSRLSEFVQKGKSIVTSQVAEAEEFQPVTPVIAEKVAVQHPVVDFEKVRSERELSAVVADQPEKESSLDDAPIAESSTASVEKVASELSVAPSAESTSEIIGDSAEKLVPEVELVSSETTVLQPELESEVSGDEGAASVTAEPLQVTLADTDLMDAYLIDKKDLEKTISRTIVYKVTGEGKAPESVVQTVVYQRSATVVPETSQITYDEWEITGPTVFEKVVSPSLSGYKVDKPVVDSAEPDLDKGHQIVVVTYELVQVDNLTVTFIEKDTDAELLNFNFVNKGFDYTEKKIKKGQSFLEYKGYKVISNNYPEGERVNDDTIHYTVVLVKAENEETVKSSEIIEDKVSHSESNHLESEKTDKKSKKFWDFFSKE